ncbi:N-acetyltransferase [Meridianimarinicoccus roseus]|uniref:N-acetyltransferase n=1 Tax=Meridianimarinicoccus roseus TaxID=2072018 RepID=A0A2V2LDA1_9RHOB|nr:N-acetyltransferase [Meridianimarinicoccus roseus]
MLAARDVALGDVVAELDRRSGRSGLDEKAARAAVPPIGPAAPDDRDGIAALYAEALPDEDLGALLEDLHGFGSGGVLELVARDTAGRVAGHCGFTLCGLGTRGATAALLGPLAVTPDRQRAGIGRALVQAGLERLGRAGVAHLLVLGDPAYYGRLGFAPATAVAPPYALPGDLADAWQVRTLDPAAPPPEGALAVPAPWRRAVLWQP